MQRMGYGVCACVITLKGKGILLFACSKVIFVA